MKHTAMEKKVFRYVVVIVCSGTGIMSPIEQTLPDDVRSCFYICV